VTPVLPAARSAYAAGLCLLPVRDDGSKAPAVPTWREHQTVRPTAEQMAAWDFASRAGFGVIAGAVSGRVESWDFDTADVFDEFVAAAHGCGLGPVVDRLRAAYEDQTPNGGRRWLVRYPEAVSWQDCTLARRPGRDGEPKAKVLIELPTFAIVAPSNGATHPSGRPYTRVSGDFTTIARYTVAERDALINLARTFDAMPRREHAPTRPSKTKTSADLKPGEDFNARTTWPALLEPAGWTAVFERGDVTYWRRPGKREGMSATTNYGGSDLFYPFTSSTEFDPETSYTKFGVYATLHHGGDFSRAALALSKAGYGTPADAPTPAAPVVPTTPHTLGETVTVFRRWLYLEDATPVYVVAATLVANQAPGDPVWVLLVCAPSTGKTEILSAAGRLPWVIPAAKVTEASLLSGTSKRERTGGATGGLLRQVGAFGVLLVKDFTSVLAQNKDSRAEAMAALREVADGSWHRPVGTDGGKVLSWQGKCGFIGGVTPALDHYGQVTASLGDRFILLRLPDADVDSFGTAALQHGDHERQMRTELAEALAGLVDHANRTRVNRPLTDDERHRLIKLAAYAARSRTAVVRDGYAQDLAYAPQVEGPGRLVKALARLLGGLEAIGCDTSTCWRTLIRVATDCAPALRTRFIRELMQQSAPARTAVIATGCGTATKTASRYLEDLSILGLAIRTKTSTADNSPDLWEASPWLRDYAPMFEPETEKYFYIHKTLLRGGAETAAQGSETTPSGTSQSHSEPIAEGGDTDLPAWVTADDGPPPEPGSSDAALADHDEEDPDVDHL